MLRQERQGPAAREATGGEEGAESRKPEEPCDGVTGGERAAPSGDAGMTTHKRRSLFDCTLAGQRHGREADRPGRIDKAGAEVPVDFLRVGRIALVYKTRDAQEYGVWDQVNKAWQTLDSSDYANWIDEGLRVAKKQSAPQLIRVPLPQPGGAS